MSLYALIQVGDIKLKTKISKSGRRTPIWNYSKDDILIPYNLELITIRI